MKFSRLMELGLSKNEAKVYLSVARFRECPAHDIIQDTSMHKKVVYDNLDRLVDKGLVSYVKEDNRRVYTLTSPEMLVENIEEEQRALADKKERAKQIADEIKTLEPRFDREQEAEIYRGKKGIRAFYRELVRIEEKHMVFGAPEDSLEIMGEPFWYNLNAKIDENDMGAQLLFNSSMVDYGEDIERNSIEVRYFDRDFEPKTETVIQGDRVAIIAWTQRPILFLIQDETVSSSYTQFFEDMWERAKPADAFTS